MPEIIRQDFRVAKKPHAYGICYVWEDPVPYQISAAIDLIESLQAQLAEYDTLAAEYGIDGKTMLTLAKSQIKTAQDNIKLQEQLAASQRRADAAVEDLSTYKDCGFCIHLQDQQYCYKNCQRHVDVDNFRTHPCWQWRGPQAEKGESE